MLSLGNEVGSHHLGIGSFIGNHQYLRWTRKHVNTTGSRNNRLGSRHPLVSRANDNIARGDCSASVRLNDAVGHGGDGLGAANAKDEVGTGNVSGGQSDGRRAGTGEDDRIASSRSGRYSSHDHRGGEGVAPARCVTSSSYARTKHCME